jgi:hypothetical protein
MRNSFLNKLNCLLVYVNFHSIELATSKLQEISSMVKFMDDVQTPFQQHTIYHTLAPFLSLSPFHSLPFRHNNFYLYSSGPTTSRLQLTSRVT